MKPIDTIKGKIGSNLWIDACLSNGLLNIRIYEMDGALIKGSPKHVVSMTTKEINKNIEILNKIAPNFDSLADLHQRSGIIYEPVRIKGIELKNEREIKDMLSSLLTFQ